MSEYAVVTKLIDPGLWHVVDITRYNPNRGQIIATFYDPDQAKEYIVEKNKEKG